MYERDHASALALTESAETLIPRAQVRSYKGRPRHLSVGGEDVLYRGAGGIISGA